ncbi:hypothetical protein CALCODRAFT_444612 [Calocera cornea HHB12733]|uniref:Helitron helicase-like domain-containing protein n=1 Tax=Calocera cornea HHB12733 TaxID=1353952 RepID=A0A165C989_9BASI|nr:hypothetical protein CALCODRAFT_444612 [Calocera cornea HHB12733]
MAAAFITLFPYGEGGPEDDRETEVSFKEHARWTLRYADRQFRLHHSWIFIMFGIIQKREALNSARLQMERRDFAQAMHALSTITIDDLKAAAEEEENQGRPSSSAVRVLLKQLRAMSARIIGSNAYRTALRNNVWGTTFYLYPPSIWFTITPNDLHDPIAQVFAGEEIDMDRFISTAGPDKKKRALNVAKDPYAAAKFFQFVMHAFLRCMFRIERTGSSVNTGKGILGEIKAYFAPVETQGKSTLHSHFLIWLTNAPTSTEMHTLLQDGIFRDRIVSYMAATMKAHENELHPDRIDKIQSNPECAYSRPPNPMEVTYEQMAHQTELTVARTVQLHACSVDTCLIQSKNGTMKCKRKAPFPLSPEYEVTAAGEWAIKRTHPFLNGWNSTIARTMRCNHDIKLLTNGGDTKDLVFYCVNYAAKPQQRSYNSVALLAKDMAYHFETTDYLSDIRERGRLMLYRCFNVLNREQEKAAPLCVLYIMGWGDVWQSHNYVAIYWSSILAELHKAYPYLCTNGTLQPE